MVAAGVVRLAVVRGEAPRRVIAMIFQGDVLGAHPRLGGVHCFERSLQLWKRAEHRRSA